MMTESKRAHLAYAKVERFGALSDRVIGPFGPHLNVVFGSNEAGKTTFASFVGGVLFGWEEARGNRNTYKPEGAERAGSLVFAPEGAGELRRARNADGLQGNVELVADIDKDTFRTMFSLTSDELRSLRNTSDVTARLLTAGSGTGTSPASALATVQAQLAEYTSRAASAEKSLVRLNAARDEARRELQEASAAAERLCAQDREFHELEPQRQAMNERMTQVNAALENMTACRVSLEKLDAEEASLEAELGRLHNEERLVVANRRSLELSVGRTLARMSGAQDRAARERIDALADRKTKLARESEVARTSAASSRASYEALCEAHEDGGQIARARKQRVAQIAVTAAMFALLMIAGVPLFVYGRRAGSLSYASLGLVMVSFALVLAAAALVMLFRPNRRDEEHQDRVEAARNVMLQDEKRLEACEANERALRQQIEERLADMGLSAADGSLRRARVLLDEAKDVRTAMALDQQRQQAATMRVTEVEERLSDIASQKRMLCERAGVSGNVTLVELDAEIARLSQERADLADAAQVANQRWGELKHELEQAKLTFEVDRCKMRYQQLCTRIEDATTDFVRLLLAKRMLEDAIESWKSKSQPEVYAQASRLLSLMTCGKWRRVALSDEGSLLITDAALTTREPNLLSLGTCQQLYLALRMALLMCADNVGRVVPIVADDILVNFDAERRRGAAQAIAELSKTRQIILLTCHEEVATLLQEAAPEAVRINL